MIEHRPTLHILRRAGVLCCVALILSGCRERGITVVSDPPGATVWIGGDIWGPAPIRVPLPGDEPLLLRTSLPGWQDTIVELTANDLPPKGVLHVALQRPGTLTLSLESRPAGAEVFVNGEFRGLTPLDLSGLEPRQTQVVFRMKDREQITRTLDLTAAQSRQRLQVDLPSLTIAYYEQKLREEPKAIHHYADLAHQYVLEHRFDDAMKTFRQGVQVIFENPGIKDAARLWSEIQRVTDKQYDYGNAEDVKLARSKLRDCLADIHQAYPDNREVQFFIAYILVLDAVNERQRAQELFEAAWKRFPQERALRQLLRKGFSRP